MLKQTTAATRREFMRWGGFALLAVPASAADKKEDEEKNEPEAMKVLPAEDLMREHGVLDRIMLIYDAARTRWAAGGDFPAQVLADAAGIVRRFIEEYHEKLEENYLFPRFEKAGKLADLTRILRQQHEAGRRLTATVIEGAKADALRDPAQRRAMAAALEQFTRMYRPHAAREDTVLFPAIRQVVGAKEYDELGETFEGIEEKNFGEGGYEKIVEQVAKLESQVGLEDLARFTPQA